MGEESEGLRGGEVRVEDRADRLWVCRREFGGERGDEGRTVMMSSMGSYSCPSFLGVRRRILCTLLAMHRGEERKTHFSVAPIPGYSSSTNGTSIPAHSLAGRSGSWVSTKSAYACQLHLVLVL